MCVYVFISTPDVAIAPAAAAFGRLLLFISTTSRVIDQVNARGINLAAIPCKLQSSINASIFIHHHHPIYY
jgi:hypothetical protein